MPAPYTRHENFPSRFVQSRHVDVWLPDDYEEKADKNFSVLYMHDGQNLFDPQATPYGCWGVIPAIHKLSKDKKKIKDTIVVGIWNTEKRLDEYLPHKPFLTTRGQKALKRISYLQGEVLSDQYLEFIVEELKPFIDSTYRTHSGPEHTFIMGSSMGGLISLYAICEYPHVFSGAGCISTHWPIIRTLYRDYLKNNLPDPKTHKIYFDFGTKGLDAKYEPHQNRIDKVMETAGYTHWRNWITQKFDGADHNETSWRERIHIPLQFLLEK